MQLALGLMSKNFFAIRLKLFLQAVLQQQKIKPLGR
jgi:hypothetical protein